MTRRVARALAWLTLLVGSLAVLRLGGSSDLAAPPLSSVGGLERWVDARDPATVAIALVRLGAEAAVWYLLALTVLHGTAAIVHRRSVHTVATVLTAPGVDRLLRAVLGAGAMVVLPLASPAGLAPATASGASVLDLTPVAAPTPDPVGTATMRPLGTPVRGTARMVPHRDPIDPPVPLPRTWRVAPGESFWTIAEEQVAAARRRPVRPDELVPYWRAVIDANRHRLVDADDPDLILPGQVLELPPVPPG